MVFLSEITKARRKWQNIFKCWKKRIVNSEFSTQWKIPFKNKGEIKKFLDEKKKNLIICHQ